MPSGGRGRKFALRRDKGVTSEARNPPPTDAEGEAAQLPFHLPSSYGDLPSIKAPPSLLVSPR